MRRRAIAVVLVCVAALAPAFAQAGSQPAGNASPLGGAARQCGQLVGDKGGCHALARGRGKVAFTIRTLAGDMRFARCLFNFEIQVDARGRTLMSRIVSAGENPCNDARPCVDAKHTRFLPWHGEIVRSGGRLVHRIDACVDSCLGQFEGKLEMEVKRTGGRLRTTFADAQVGDSGFVFDGGSWDWRLRPSTGR